MIYAFGGSPALKLLKAKSVLILGTSDNMVIRIAERTWSAKNR